MLKLTIIALEHKAMFNLLSIDCTFQLIHQINEIK